MPERRDVDGWESIYSLELKAAKTGERLLTTCSQNIQL